jgi:hypothetical protein
VYLLAHVPVLIKSGLGNTRKTYHRNICTGKPVCIKKSCSKFFPPVAEYNELHKLYASPKRRVTKSRRMRWAGHVTQLGEMRNIYNILIGKSEGKRPLARSRRRWEDMLQWILRK